MLLAFRLSEDIILSKDKTNMVEPNDNLKRLIIKQASTKIKSV